MKKQTKPINVDKFLELLKNKQEQTQKKEITFDEIIELVNSQNYIIKCSKCNSEIDLGNDKIAYEVCLILDKHGLTDKFCQQCEYDRTDKAMRELIELGYGMEGYKMVVGN